MFSAQIHEYMNWHHLNTRNSSMIVLNQLLANIGRATPEQKRMLETKDQVIADLLRSLELWPRHGRPFIASTDKPTLADLSCYNELVQLELMGLVGSADEELPRLAAWLARMKQVRLDCSGDDAYHCCYLLIAAALTCRSSRTTTRCSRQ